MTLSHLLQSLKERISDEQQSMSQRRVQTFKERLIQDWNADRAKSFAGVRDQLPYATPCFKSGDLQFITKHAELHQMMIDAWSPIFHRFSETPSPSYDAFIRQFPMALPAPRQHDADHPFAVLAITADD